MSVVSVPHINFRGDARQALEFYHSVFGGQVMIATYGQVGVPQDAPHADHLTFGPVAPDSPDVDHVAFGLVAADNGFRVAAYDVFGKAGGGIAGSSAATARRADGLTHTESFFLLDLRRHSCACWLMSAPMVAGALQVSDNTPRTLATHIDPYCQHGSTRASLEGLRSWKHSAPAARRV